MSIINKTKEEWVGYKQGSLTVLDKIGEKEFTTKNKHGIYKYKSDILLVKCDCSKELELNSRSFISNKINTCRGCFKRRDDIGKKFGKLTVLDWYNTKNKSGRSYVIYNCICDCGNKTSARNEIITNYEKTCCSKCKTSSKLTFNPTTINKYYKSVKGGAIRRSIEFSIGIEYLLLLLDQQNQKCKLSGQFISFENGTASLDRIDNNIGYIESNIQWVHRSINYMKNELNNEAFKDYCKLVYLNTIIQ